MYQSLFRIVQQVEYLLVALFYWDEVTIKQWYYFRPMRWYS